MKRKLVKQAGQAVTITLPIDWIRKNNLKPGDEIDIEASEKDLILRSDKKIIGEKIKLNLTDLQKRIKYTYLNAAYAKGVDEIELEAEKGFFPDFNQNIGYAVVSHNKNIYTIKDISGVSQENLDEIFKRVFQMILGFYNKAINNIFGETKESFETVRRIDTEINKFALFLERSIMKLSYPDPSIGRIMFAYSFCIGKNR